MTIRKQRYQLILVSLLAVPLVIYIGLATVMFTRQEALIFSGSATQGRPEAMISAPPSWSELVTLKTPKGDSVAALFAQASSRDGSPLADSGSRPTILYCYGSGQTLRRMTPMIDGLRRDGLNVIVPEYLGYGMSGGTPGQDGCRQAAEACYEYLLKRKDIDSNKIVIEGGSLGAAVAVDLATRRPFAGLIIMSGFTSMTDMSLLQYSWLPISLLLKHPMNSLEKIGQVSCPILIAHGTRDELVPFEMAGRLASATHAPTTMLTIPDADHNDTLYLCGPSGALLPTTMRPPHAKFTPTVHRTIQHFFESILADTDSSTFPQPKPPPESQPPLR